MELLRHGATAGTAYEEVEFFGGPDLVFGCRHMPGGPPRAGVVVCSPLPYGATTVYLPDARLGRNLARAGIVAQRFHYRGTGHSDGDPAAVSLDTMVEDARAALAHLRQQCGLDQVGLLGAAAGATVAALVARDLPGAPVALWRPFEPAAPDHRLSDLLGLEPRPLLVAAAGLGGPGVGGAGGPGAPGGVAWPGIDVPVGPGGVAWGPGDVAGPGGVVTAGGPGGLPGGGLPAGVEPGGLAEDIALWRSRSFDVETVAPAGPPGGPSLVEATVAWFARQLALGRDGDRAGGVVRDASWGGP
ncbi:MAG TPA: alpha/beta hydrolase [Acidimicrobiales bacterium]